MNIPDQSIDPSLCNFRFPSVSFERGVDIAQVRDLACPQGQIMTHERVEMGAIAILGKAHLDRMPMVLIDPALVVRLEAHQNKIPDQIGLAELAACRGLS